METLTVLDSVFGVKPKTSVVHQVFVALMANLRRPWAHTKDRGDVRGGGKKPWKQKGTGRARHGSIRSPIWKGGGVTFGPLSVRNYKQKINKKMSQTALRMSLSDRVGDGKLLAVEEFPADGKTKTVVALHTSLPVHGARMLFLTVSTDEMIARAVRNITAIDIARAADVNVLDILHHPYIVATKSAVKALERRLAPVAKKV